MLKGVDILKHTPFNILFLVFCLLQDPSYCNMVEKLTFFSHTYGSPVKVFFKKP